MLDNTTTVPKEKFDCKASFIRAYCPNNSGVKKISKKIYDIMIATTGDPHAGDAKLVTPKQAVAIIKYLGFPTGYTIDDFPFITNDDV